MTSFPKSTPVLIHSLSTRTDLNGKTGTVIKTLDGERVRVKLNGAENPVLIKPSNLSYESCDTSLLKAEWEGMKYTAPEDDPTEPYELGLVHEDAQCRQIVQEGVFPSPVEFEDLMRYRNSVRPSDTFFDTYAKHPEVIYSSVARLFFSSFTDEFEARALVIGYELHELGEMKTMQTSFYAFSDVVQKMAWHEHGSPIMGTSFYKKLEFAWDGVGHWYA